MRVYEFAKEKKLSSREVLDLLEKGGYTFASHMAVLTDQALVYLKDNLGESKKEAPKKSVPKAKAKATPPSSSIGTQSSRTKQTPVPSLSGVTPTAPIKQKPAPRPEAPKPTAAKPAPASAARPGFQRRGAPSRGRQTRSRNIPPRPRQFNAPPPEITEIIVSSDMAVHAVATLMGKPVGVIILALLKKGMASNQNQVIDVATIRSLAEQFEIIIREPEVAAVINKGRPEFKTEAAEARYPIVVVMGHVDHGKTTFLDYVRKMNTAAREKGGITQHLSAYEVESSHGKIIFLDTPGHEAFTRMRKRGARITDLAVLMVAADDGVKPQTIEAIKHAREAEVPIIVAINKIDKLQSEAAIETVKLQLAEQDLLPEDWGGETICVPISAKTGKGIEELLEMIVLQAEMMDLKANKEVPSKAFVLEANLERGYGPVATVVPLEGVIKKGDYFVCGSTTGRVRLLINSMGERLTQSGPSIPVQVVGFNQFASLGDWLEVVPQKTYAKAKSTRGYVQSGAPASQAMSELQEQVKKVLPLVVRADTQGSLQAVLDSIEKILKQNKDIPATFQIIRSGAGEVSESDITLAFDAGARILGMHTKVERKAAVLAREKGLSVELFDVIYHLAENLEETLEKRRVKIIKFNEIGRAEVLKVFDIKGAGVIAGCNVTDGKFSKISIVACIRDGEEVGRGKVKSLQRERKAVKEVHAGNECGFVCDGFNGWQVGDTVVAYEEEA